MDQVSCLPTRFAIKMATAVKLYDHDEEFSDDYCDHERLEMFQSVSVVGKFEEAISAAYFGRNITKVQISILEVIHRLTSKWLLGKLSQTLLDRLDIVAGLADKGKDVADISGKILELLGVSNEIDKVKSNKESRMILEFTDVSKVTKKRA